MPPRANSAGGSKEWIERTELTTGRAIERLRTALRCLPGVGPKSAQRMTFHLLERDRDGAQEIADALHEALQSVTNCERCNNFSETPLCSICASDKRDKSVLCIVEHPADLEAIESAGVFAGTYFVLMGRLSPLDGVGPQQLGLDKLERLLSSNEVKELIMATNLTVEGEATAHFVAEMVSGRPLLVTRLARGVPVGGELEYMDHGTLEQAFDGRRTMDQ